MTDSVDPGTTSGAPRRDDRRSAAGRGPRAPRKVVAAGLAAGLIGGGAAGLVLGNVGLSGAAGVSSAQAEQPADGAEDPAARAREHLNEVLSPLVADGTINQEQADAVIQALIDAAPDHPRRPGGPHRGHGAMRMRLAAAAEAIGIEPSELADALRSGSTIAGVASDHGVDTQVVIDAMVAEATDQLRAAVDAGRITQDRMDQRVEGLEERITDLVNNGRPDRGDRPGDEGDAPAGSPAPEGEGG